MKGQFITIEGVDGSGKSTQIRMLNAYLQQRGFDTIVTHEPGGTEIGEQIRKIILDTSHGSMTGLTEVFLYTAARTQHVSEVIMPALQAGKMVICSRFFDSTVAYQGYGAGLDLLDLAEINRIAVGTLVPDLTLIFDLDPEQGLERVSARNENIAGEMKDRMEQKNIDFHRRVRKGFLALADQHQDRIRMVDASGEEWEVFSRTQRFVDEYLNNLAGQGEI